MYDCNADCPSPSAPLVYVFLGVGAWGWAVVQRRPAHAPDSGGAQAGGVSPPFTVCVHSWFEVFGVRREGKGVGRRWEGASGVGRGEREG